MAEAIKEFSKEALLYVTSEDGSSKGWRVDLLVEKLSSKVEEKVLLCSCCNGLLRDACLCNGALMCQVCIPEDTVVQPVVMNREIVNEKMIYCPLKSRGCGWSYTVNGAVHHLEDCVYLPEACPLRCVSLEGEKKGEVVRMERRHIPEHVRDSCPLREIVCEFCGAKLKGSEMNPHLEDCEEFPLDCPNGCSREGEDGVREVKRKDIPVHLDNHCPLHKVQCPYWDHGCKEEMERRHTDTHEREFLHIHYKLSMTKAEQKQNDSIQLLANRIAVLEKKDSDKDSNFKLSMTNAEQKQIESTQRLQHNLDAANAELNAATERIEILEKHSSAKDLQIASLLASNFPKIPKGRLEWKVKEVKQKIQNKVDTYSDPFYVGLYKCQGNIIWDYKNTGNIGVFICIMRGDFDVKLLWPMRYKRTFILINQINSKYYLVDSIEITKADLERLPECFKRPSDYRNRGLGRASFISNIALLEEKYYRQDSITLHISVKLLPSL